MRWRWTAWATALIVVISAGFLSPFIWIVGGIILMGFLFALARQTSRVSRVIMNDGDIARGVLLLRPFAKDRKAGGGMRRNPIASNLGLLGGLWQWSAGIMQTFEEIIAPHIGEVFGPLFSLGSPEERLPPPGGRRLYADDDEWQEVVQRCALEARYVLVIGGTTPNLARELEFLRDHVSPEKVFLLIEPTDRDPWPEIRQTLLDARWNMPVADPGPGSVIAFAANWEAKLVASHLREGSDFAEVLGRWVREGKREEPSVVTTAPTPEAWETPRLERPVNWTDLGDLRNFGGRLNQLAVIFVVAATGFFFATIVAPAVGGARLIVALLIAIPVIPVYLVASAAGRFLAERGLKWALMVIVLALTVAGSVTHARIKRAEIERVTLSELEQQHQSALNALTAGNVPEFRALLTILVRQAELARSKQRADPRKISETLREWNAAVPAFITQHWNGIESAAIRRREWHEELASLLQERRMSACLIDLRRTQHQFMDSLLHHGIHVTADFEENPSPALRTALVDGTVASLRHSLKGWELYTEWPLQDPAEPDDAVRARLLFAVDEKAFDGPADQWPQIPEHVALTIMWSGRTASLPWPNPTIINSGQYEAEDPTFARLGMKPLQDVPWLPEAAREVSETNTKKILDDIDHALVAR